MQDTTFIYALSDPRTGIIRYVGKANNPAYRLRMHMTPRSLNAKTHKNSWLKQLKAKGLRPTLSILQEVQAHEWQAAERAWIKHYRGQLVNMTDGGDGIHNPSAEVRRRMGLAGIGRSPWNKGKRMWETRTHPNIGRKMKGHWKGKRLSKEHRANLSAAHVGIPTWSKGVPMRASTRDKLSQDWLVTPPSGKPFRVRNLKAFCKENNLRDSLMHHVATGKRKHHKGWLCQKLGLNTSH